MLRVVCWKWKPPAGYRSKHTAENVNVLFNMVQRNYPHPFEMVCFTDDAEGIDPRIKTLPVWDTYFDIESPLGHGYPTCYRRLLAFDPVMEQVIGGRFVSLDLDCVITGDLSPLWNRPEDFIIWGADTRKTPYNGSMWMMNPGARAQVIDSFRAAHASDEFHSIIRKVADAGICGSDQAWIAHALGDQEPVWTKDDGVYVWRTHLKNRNFYLPRDARIVFFQGSEDPWETSAKDKAPWILEHYR